MNLLAIERQMVEAFEIQVRAIVNGELRRAKDLVCQGYFAHGENRARARVCL